MKHVIMGNGGGGTTAASEIRKVDPDAKITIISEETGYSLETATLEQLGRAGKVIATKENTTIIDGVGDASAIQDHIHSIQRKIELSTSEYDDEKLQERVAKLSGGVALIKVG